MKSPVGISLHIGINICDPEHYNGWDGPLTSCENDADTMQELARKQGFYPQQLKTAHATRGSVTQAVRDAAGILTAGDFYLLTYSGHGGQIRDFDGDEEDGVDDTWCLYDGQLLDDELHVLFSEFDPGVRLLLLSDSCHSGTLLKGEVEGSTVREQLQDDFIHSRAMPRDAAVNTLRKNRSFYQDIQRNLPDPRPEIGASVRLLSGCQEDQRSFGNAETGRFTAAVKQVFADGEFAGDYKKFHRDLVEAVSKAMNPQTPGHMVIGKENQGFDREPPFRI